LKSTKKKTPTPKMVKPRLLYFSVRSVFWVCRKEYAIPRISINSMTKMLNFARALAQWLINSI
jgi:hypothetical protein